MVSRYAWENIGKQHLTLYNPGFTTAKGNQSSFREEGGLWKKYIWFRFFHQWMNCVLYIYICCKTYNHAFLPNRFSLQQRDGNNGTTSPSIGKEQNPLIETPFHKPTFESMLLPFHIAMQAGELYVRDLACCEGGRRDLVAVGCVKSRTELAGISQCVSNWKLLHVFKYLELRYFQSISILMWFYIYNIYIYKTIKNQTYSVNKESKAPQVSAFFHKASNLESQPWWGPQLVPKLSHKIPPFV